jgi:hypothetical protein
MSVKSARSRRLWFLAVLIPGLALLAAAIFGRRGGPIPGDGTTTAIRASLERVVPTHNDVIFVYLLENQTDADYRIPEEHAIRLRARSASTKRLLNKLPEQVTGDFPLLLPARSKTHFALILTSQHEVQPEQTAEFRKSLDIDSFILFDPTRHYEIELPANGGSN